MSGLLGFMADQLVNFWQFTNNVRIIGGPTLFQIIVASVFTSLTFAFLFFGGAKYR